MWLSVKPQISSCLFGDKNAILRSVNGENATAMPKQMIADVRANGQFLRLSLDN